MRTHQLARLPGMAEDFPEEWFRPPPEADDRTRVRPTAPASYNDQFRPRWQPASPVATPVPAPAPEAQSPLAPPTVPSVTSHSVGEQNFPRDGAPTPPPAQRGVFWRRALGVVIGATVLGGAGWGGWQLLGHPDEPKDPSTTSAVTQPSSSASKEALAAWTGPVRVVKPVQVAASCTAPDQPGYDGATVSSAAGRVLDGDATTGWRCDGNATGQTLTFTFEPGTSIVGVRVVNGYTKITNGIDLYSQYRRATSLEWSFPGQQSAFFVQSLNGSSAAPQETRIPEMRTDGTVRMEVKATTEPGSSEPTRDALVMTEVTFLAKG